MGKTTTRTVASQPFRRVAAVLLLVAGAGTAQAQEARPATPAPPPGVARDLLLDYLSDHDTFLLVDARSPEEFAASHIEGAVNIPHDTVHAHAAELPADFAATIVVYCKTGRRAGLVRDSLVAQGYSDVRVLDATQIHWFDGLAVFNCASEVAPPSAQDLLKESSVDPGGDR